MSLVLMFGGTLDPIHVGHLRTALELTQHLLLSQLRLIPAQTPPHRGTPRACADDRLAMARLAVRELAGIDVGDRELRREGPLGHWLAESMAPETLDAKPCGLICRFAVTRLDIFRHAAARGYRPRIVDPIPATSGGGGLY